MNEPRIPTVAIVGRANVGKSTLFNRLIGKRRAIVADRPGVTRDRIMEDIEMNDRAVRFVDTGGLEFSSEDELSTVIRDQVEAALHDADLYLVVFDARRGLTVEDEEVVRNLRAFGRPMLGVLNKVDPGSSGLEGEEFYALGLKALLPISAEHGLGIESLREEILSRMEDRAVAPGSTSDSIKIAFVGRPNVGKSSLVNALLSQPRMAVSEIPGTTRDVVDTEIQKDEQKFLLLDTAGIRRRSKVSDRVEHVSAMRSFEAVDRADVAVLVLDVGEEITTQDQKIASHILEKGCGLLIAMNKWDLVQDSPKKRETVREEIYWNAPFLRFAAVRFVSAKTGEGVDGILSQVKQIQDRKRKRFSSEILKKLFFDAAPRVMAGVDFFGLTQADERIPTFFLWCKDPRKVPVEFEAYWRNFLSEKLELEGVPLRIVFRAKRGHKRGQAKKGTLA